MADQAVSALIWLLKAAPRNRMRCGLSALLNIRAWNHHVYFPAIFRDLSKKFGRMAGKTDSPAAAFRFCPGKFSLSVFSGRRDQRRNPLVSLGSKTCSGSVADWVDRSA